MFQACIPETFRVSDHPVRAISEREHFLDAASTPPHEEGNTPRNDGTPGEAVIEDSHEPRLKANDENARRNGSKGLTASFSLQV